MNKQIEEIARIIATQACISNKDGVCRLDKKPCDLCCNTSILFKECAEALYNAGYTQKVSDDEIVISKEEYEKLKFNETLCEAIRADKKLEVETASKETAKDILKYLVGSAKMYVREKYGVEVENG